MTPVRASARVILVLGIVLGSAVAARAVEILSGPTLTMDPNGTTPLSGVVELETDTPVQAELTITDGTDLWTVTFADAVQPDTPGPLQSVPGLGIKTNTIILDHRTQGIAVAGDSDADLRGLAVFGGVG